MTTEHANAFGGPEIQPRWTSSAKTGVGTALSDKSHVWFTMSHGIFNEFYSPRIDKACSRDMGFIVTDAKDFFSEEKSATVLDVQRLAEGVPAFRLVNTSRDEEVKQHSCTGGKETSLKRSRTERAARDVL